MPQRGGRSVAGRAIGVSVHDCVPSCVDWDVMLQAPMLELWHAAGTSLPPPIIISLLDLKIGR
jgi:hypothetical protein